VVSSGFRFNSWFVNEKVTWNGKLTINAGIRLDHYSHSANLPLSRTLEILDTHLRIRELSSSWIRTQSEC